MFTDFSRACPATKAASSSRGAAPRAALASLYNKQMIPKVSKFPLRTELVAFRARAKKNTSPLTTCYWLPSTKPSRLSVIIPKKLNKLTTTRNWLKRLTYDALWSRIKDQQLDCVIIFKPLPLKKSPSVKAQINSELKNLTIKIK